MNRYALFTPSLPGAVGFSIVLEPIAAPVAYFGQNGCRIVYCHDEPWTRRYAGATSVNATPRDMARAGKTEPQVVVSVVRGGPVAFGRAEVLWVGVPPPAPVDTLATEGPSGFRARQNCPERNIIWRNRQVLAWLAWAIQAFALPRISAVPITPIFH